MSIETKIAETKKAIIKKAKALANVLQTLRESDEYIQETQADKVAEITKLEKRREGIDNKIAQLRLAIDEADPENTQLVEDKQNEAARLEKEIKALAHGMPVECLMKKGFKVVDDEDNVSVSVTVSKAQIVTAFNAEALLEEFPELVAQEIDGDFVVVRTIDAAVLERLVEQEDVSKDVYKHRTTAKAKNPSVRIAT